VTPAILAIVIVVLGFAVVGLLAWSMCRVAAQSDKDMEKFNDTP
jgi:hypothetical protein